MTPGDPRQRVLVGGISGSGKSTVARTLHQRLGLPYVELDSLFHGPGWVKRPDFEADVAEIAAGERWVMEDQYHRFLGDLLWQRADTLVWLDLPRPVIIRRLLRRSAVRWVARQELWHGNRERAREWLTRDHPIRYAWDHYAERRAIYERLAADPAYRHIDVIHLRSAGDVAAWLGSITTPE